MQALSTQHNGTKMNRKERIKIVKQRLNGRKLIWMGNRASETEALEGFHEELECFVSVIAPIEHKKFAILSLENRSLRRVDLNAYSMDNDKSNELDNLYNELLRNSHKDQFVVVPYIPTMFLTSLLFSRSDNLVPWSVFYLKHKAYTYKPWVETELKKRDVNIIPWKYFSDGNYDEFVKFADGKPTILKVSQGSGGAGIILANEPSAAHQFTRNNNDRFFSASHYMENAVPISINAVVYSDGQTRTFHPSVQLIGIKEATKRDFGFCGSDFAAVEQFAPEMWDESEKMIEKIGKWLHETGYRGVFGVDLLFNGDEIFFVEINPRFTASCTPSAAIAKSLGTSDPVIEHMASMSEATAPDKIPLRETVRLQLQYPLSQIIVYNTASISVNRAGDFKDNYEGYRIFELPDKNVSVVEHGELFKIEYQRSVTTSGKTLHSEIARNVKEHITHWRTNTR